MPDGQVAVVSVSSYGMIALEVTYTDLSGRVSSRLLYRDWEEQLEIVEAGRPWSFHEDGRLFRLASNAYRIRLAYLFDPLLAVHIDQTRGRPARELRRGLR